MNNKRTCRLEALLGGLQLQVPKYPNPILERILISSYLMTFRRCDGQTLLLSRTQVISISVLCHPQTAILTLTHFRALRFGSPSQPDIDTVCGRRPNFPLELPLKSEEISLKDPSLPHLPHMSQPELGQWALVWEGACKGVTHMCLIVTFCPLQKRGTQSNSF